MSCRDDPTPSRGSQLPRAAALIVSSLGFIHDLRAEVLEPDTVRGAPLDMNQYRRLFGTARVPTDVSASNPMVDDHYSPYIYLCDQRGCRMEIEEKSRHVAIIRRGQFCAYFNVLL